MKRAPAVTRSELVLILIVFLAVALVAIGNGRAAIRAGSGDLSPTAPAVVSPPSDPVPSPSGLPSVAPDATARHTP